jgi:hypothetical protein
MRRQPLMGAGMDSSLGGLYNNRLLWVPAICGSLWSPVILFSAQSLVAIARKKRRSALKPVIFRL